jgi:hypothetical protein
MYILIQGKLIIKLVHMKTFFIHLLMKKSSGVLPQRKISHIHFLVSTSTLNNESSHFYVNFKEYVVFSHTFNELFTSE